MSTVPPIDCPSEWSLVGVHDVIADTVGSRDMVICGDVRRSFAEVARRTRGLAAYLASRGLGCRRERSSLDPWESGQDAIALLMHNGGEYLEAMYGAFRARAVPFNVNQHYRPTELGALLGDLDTRSAIYHRRYGPLLAASTDVSALVLIDVDDGSGVAPLPGSVGFEAAVATDPFGLPETSPDDLYIVCTGGTTGRPKAVLWRQGDIYVAAMAGSPDATAETIAGAARKNPGLPWFAVPPLMHAAAQWTSFCALHGGSPILFHDDSGPLDARVVLETAERERAHLMSIVGDSYARPLIEELRRRPYELSSLAVIGTGGAVTTDPTKAELLELLPHVIVMDGYGSSESGTMAYGASSGNRVGSSFQPNPGSTVVSEDRSRELRPGEEAIGWTARRGAVPLGYLGDPAMTRATFPVVDGERMSVPGDRARLLGDGSIAVLGRDSMVVNTGGEKVFVEEVEATLLAHPDIRDALVVGRPSARFGEEVVAVVSPRSGRTLSPREIREFVAGRLARFKAPRAVLICDTVSRHASGKADYRWARNVAVDASDATT